MEDVDVLLSPHGTPLKIRRQGRIWNVAVEPTCHFERVNWWEDLTFNIKKGQADRIDYAVWHVQVRLGSNERSELLSWELVERPRTHSWIIRSPAVNTQK
ncbi:hypothetical protein ACTXJG_04685 [Glutamicibacter arilaitensis]|uniref:hypothetical protein n=1 Tax=Glutamicibacter arilaitensis TaxID=256701 RepID=UPI003FD38B03